jgi:hypothetical protein
MRLARILAVLLMIVPPAFAAESPGTVPRWSSQTACEMATKAVCVQDDAKAWRAAEGSKKTVVKKVAKKPDAAVPPPAPVAENVIAAPAAAPVPPVAPQSAPAEPAKPEDGFFAKLFGGKKAGTAKPETALAPHAEPKTAVERAAIPATPKVPEPVRPPVDPEAALRGKVWTAEAACKKEALKGNCTAIDCATHNGGACTGYTSMIWIYR